MFATAYAAAAAGLQRTVDRRTKAEYGAELSLLPGILRGEGVRTWGIRDGSLFRFRLADRRRDAYHSGGRRNIFRRIHRKKAGRIRQRKGGEP